MRQIISAILFGIALTFLAVAQDPPEPPDIGITKPCADGIDNITNCPETGCGNEFGDIFLNRRKNQIPETASGEFTKLQEIRALLEPPTWNTGSDRKSVTGPGREGTPV